MGYFNQTIFYALLMCIAGSGIPVMTAINSGLGTKLHSPALATTILFIVGSVVSLVYLFLSDGIPKYHPKEPIHFGFYLGGLFVIFYILSITWVAPKFGIANTISLVLLGQLISMTVIDHYGLLGALQQTFSSQRFAGLALMIIGVFLNVRRF